MENMEKGMKRGPFKPPFQIHPTFSNSTHKDSNQCNKKPRPHSISDNSQPKDGHEPSFAVIKTIFFIVSIAGFAFNMTQISYEYFRYDVITEVLYGVPHILEYPSITLCTSYHKIINNGKLDEMPEYLVSKSEPVSNLTHEKKEGKGAKKQKPDAKFEPTIEQIFRLTPKEGDLIVNCSYRKPGAKKSFVSYRTHCSHALSIEKYIHLHHICYKITYRDHDHSVTSPNGPHRDVAVYDNKTSTFFNLIQVNETYSYHDIKYHIMSLDSFLQISLNATPFSSSTSFFASIFSPTKFVRGNDVFNIQLKRGHIYTPDGLNHSRDHYFLSFQRIITHLLPPPFKTNCYPYKYNNHDLSNTTIDSILFDAKGKRVIENTKHNSRQECIDHCIAERVSKELNLAPFTSLTFNSSSTLKFITEKKLEKCSFSSKLHMIVVGCVDYCNYFDCRRTLYVTKFMRSEVIDSKLKVIKFRVMTPFDADIQIDFYATLDLRDYIANIASCLGIWLGLCLLDSKELIFKVLKLIKCSVKAIFLE